MKTPALFPLGSGLTAASFAVNARALLRLAATAILCLALSLVLTACGAILDPGPPLNQVLLAPRMPAPSQAKPLPLQLVVAAPTAGNDISTDRIAGLMQGYQVRYLNSAKWSAFVPDLMQRLLVDALEATRGLAGVGTNESGLSGQVMLDPDIRRFYLRYDEAGAYPTADISLHLRLIDLRNGKSLGNTTINVARPCKGEGTRELVNAVNEALSEALDQSATWVLTTLKPSS